MKTLGVLARKGGAGKSTLTLHWAVEAERQGEGRVAVIDIDPQQTSVNILPGMNAGASTYAVPSPIKGSGTAWVLLGSWALSPARPTPIHPRHECRGLSALFGEVKCALPQRASVLKPDRAGKPLFLKKAEASTEFSCNI